MKRPAPPIPGPAGWAGFGLKEALNESLPDLSDFKNGHSRLRGNGLSKPLDSGLRRNDGGGED